MWTILWRIWRRPWLRKSGWPAPDFCPGLCFLSRIFCDGDFADLLRFFVKNVVQDVVFCVAKMDKFVVEVWVVRPFVGVIASLVLVIELEGCDVWVD